LAGGRQDLVLVGMNREVVGLQRRIVLSHNNTSLGMLNQCR
jgi:hypothetical protein